jgi:excisionase family DNA binding protein
MANPPRTRDSVRQIFDAPVERPRDSPAEGNDPSREVRDLAKPEPRAHRSKPVSRSAAAFAISSPMAPRRGLSREEAARYVGIGTTKFDELVKERKMPMPRLIDGRKVWDIRHLDRAFDELPQEGAAAEGGSWGDF